MEGIVDRPCDAVAEEEEEKDDADVFENHIDDLHLALHFSVFQELGCRRDGGWRGTKEGRGAKKEGMREERKRGWFLMNALDENVVRNFAVRCSSLLVG